MEDQNTTIDVKYETCMVQGCYMKPELIADPNTNKGLCCFHAATENSDAWNFITDNLNNAQTVRILRGFKHLCQCQAIHPLDTRSALQNLQKAASDAEILQGHLPSPEEPVESYKYKLFFALVNAIAKDAEKKAVASGAF